VRIKKSSDQSGEQRKEKEETCPKYPYDGDDGMGYSK